MCHWTLLSSYIDTLENPNIFTILISDILMKDALW